MKPPIFAYTAPDDLDAACRLLEQHGYEAKILAGGQSLIPLLNFRLAKPGLLIDLNRLEDLDYVRPTPEGGVSIGAMTRQSRLEKDPLIAAKAPLLREAVPFIAHPQIRNRGTIGGTLAHADPAAELPTVAVALEARFRLQSVRGDRWVEAGDFFVGLLTTALAADEILVEVELPPPVERCGTSFVEIARRHGDYALAGLAAQVALDDADRCTSARLVYLSAGDGPVLASAVSAQLIGQKIDAEIIGEVAATIAEHEVDPSGDIHASAEFKRHLCRVLTQRALERCLERVR